jgi:hypothetical protein
MSHPLDRVVWNAFTSRQASLALWDGDALRVRVETQSDY